MLVSLVPERSIRRFGYTKIGIFRNELLKPQLNTTLMDPTITSKRFKFQETAKRNIAQVVIVLGCKNSLPLTLESYFIVT